MSNGFRFELQATDPTTGARAGRWTTPHGTVDTPIFMPVGTQGSVKGILPEQLHQAGVHKILANTYHLALRPGPETIADLGGLHSFMNWDGPILTDSGGFQVFSLARLSKMDDEAVVFRSHIDGSPLVLSPERAMEIQELLGADCIMCLDECPAHGVPREKVEEAVARTTRWARRCRDAHQREDQALFGIVQGEVIRDLRERSAEELIPLDFPGYAIGGLSVGEAPELMYQTLDWTTPVLPEDKPRYLMGVGRPEDLVEGVCRGVDLFDCVMPTRNARNALAFTSTGKLRLRNACHANDESPLDAACDCVCCSRYSRAYLRHMFMASEMLGPILLTIHNLTFYQTLMRELRDAIFAGEVESFRSGRLAQWNSSV